MPTVEMSFTPLPVHVRTARLVATAVARRNGVEEALLDEVRLAVGEACSRAVEAHQQHCPAEPVRVALTGGNGRFEVVVTDAAAADEDAAGGWPGPVNGAANGDGTAAAQALLPHGLGLAVIAGLADDVQVSRTAAGLSIRMSWPLAGPAPADPAARRRLGRLASVPGALAQLTPAPYGGRAGRAGPGTRREPLLGRMGRLVRGTVAVAAGWVCDASL